MNFWSSLNARSAAFIPAYASGSSTLDSALVRGIRLNAWNTNPIRRLRTRASCRSVNRLTSTPSSRYRPEVGMSRHPRMFISVDLPEPDEPMMARYSPRRTVNDIPRSACTSVSPIPYVLVTPRTSRTGCSVIRRHHRDGRHRHRHRRR